MRIAENSNDSERRQKARRRVYLGAGIVIGSEFPPVDCLVKNLSQTGAKILANDRIMPLCFALHINKTGVQHDAAIVWRRGPEIGVSFRADQRPA